MKPLGLRPEVSPAAEDKVKDVVLLMEDYVGRNNRKGQKHAVGLDEIGLRMETGLVRTTEGVPRREGVLRRPSRASHPRDTESPGSWAGLGLAGPSSRALGPPKPSPGLGWAQAFKAGLPRLQGFELGRAHHYSWIRHLHDWWHQVCIPG